VMGIDSGLYNYYNPASLMLNAIEASVISRRTAKRVYCEVKYKFR